MPKDNGKSLALSSKYNLPKHSTWYTYIKKREVEEANANKLMKNKHAKRKEKKKANNSIQRQRERSSVKRILKQ